MPEPAYDTIPNIQPGDHEGYMRFALDLATKSPPKPTNYRVGAVLVDPANNEVLSTGFTLELPGNTHAEQCCIEKLARKHSIPPERLGEALPESVVLYTTMEPCSLRLSGNTPCVDRIMALGSHVQTVYVGVQEPETFVSDNSSYRRLTEAGIQVVHVKGFEDDILRVSTAGHKKRS
ncbi:cytidine deaminase-like protein [Xylariaceae sp. FL0594]|nr:cytidine deaminase-like protein [Xylariaceae sp. FL0594]